MKYRNFSFTPNFRGNYVSDRFKQIDNLFSKLTGERPLGNYFPTYDLIKRNEIYELILSVPGYSKDEIFISVLNTSLKISGKIKNVDVSLKQKKMKDSLKYLHKGIIKRDFSLNFDLDYKIKVSSADLKDGLLSMRFIYDMPEKDKPQNISINYVDNEKIDKE